MDWENGFGSEGLTGNSERELPDGFVFGSTSGPFEAVGAVARSVLKRDVFFLGTGTLDAGAVRSTISLIGAERDFLATGVRVVGGCGAGEMSRSSENLTDFLVDVVGDGESLFLSWPGSI